MKIIKIVSIKNRIISKMMLKKEKKLKLNILIIKRMIKINHRHKIIAYSADLSNLTVFSRSRGH